MSGHFVFYTLVMLLLAGVALLQHMNAAKLSLPISPWLSLGTILFLFLTILSTGISSRLTGASRPYQALGRALRITQAIITIVLATLFFSSVPPSDSRDCLLSTSWQRLFSSHDAGSIRRIQDALQCCGYNTARDRAWPFPNHETSSRCEEMFGRTLACAKPLQVALQRASGFDFGVVLFSGLALIVYLLLDGHTSFSTTAAVPKRIRYHGGVRAPLLPHGDGESASHIEETSQHDAGRQDVDDAGRPWRA